MLQVFRASNHLSLRAAAHTNWIPHPQAPNVVQGQIKTTRTKINFECNSSCDFMCRQVSAGDQDHAQKGKSTGKVCLCFETGHTSHPSNLRVLAVLRAGRGKRRPQWPPPLLRRESKQRSSAHPEQKRLIPAIWCACGVIFHIDARTLSELALETSYHNMVAVLLTLLPGPFRLEKLRSSKASSSDAQRLCSVWESSKGYLNRRDGGLQSSATTALQCIKKHKKNTVSESIQQVAEATINLLNVSAQKSVTCGFKNAHLFFNSTHVSFLASPATSNIFWIPRILLQLMSFRSVAGPIALSSGHRFGVL